MLFVLVAPIVRLGTQFVLWTFPFTKHQHSWLELIHEVGTQASKGGASNS